MAMLGEVGVKETRLPGDDALSRRSRRRHAGARQARHDQGLRRPRAEQSKSGSKCRVSRLPMPNSTARPSTSSSSQATSCRSLDSTGGSSLRPARRSRPRCPGGGKPNPACASSTAPSDANPPDENGQSVGSVITFGKFRMIDLGDLLWNNEFDLMCPNNPVGPVDLYVVSHHGTDPSGSPALVQGRRRASPSSRTARERAARFRRTQTLNSSPNFQDDLADALVV